MININRTPIYLLLAYLFIFSSIASAQNIRSYEQIVLGPINISEYFLIFTSPKYFHITGIGEFNSLSFEKRKQLLTPEKNREILIDTKRAYLKILFKEELESKLTMTYFAKEGKDRVIAVSVYLAGGDCNEYYTDFYEYRDKNWNSVIKEVLPEIRLEHFLHEGQRLPNEKHLDYKKISWDFEFPRLGTAIKLRPAPVIQYGLCIFDMYKPDSAPRSLDDQEKILKDFCSVINSARKRTISLGWDKGKGKFFVDNKHLTSWIDMNPQGSFNPMFNKPGLKSLACQ